MTNKIAVTQNICPQGRLLPKAGADGGLGGVGSLCFMVLFCPFTDSCFI